MPGDFYTQVIPAAPCRPSSSRPSRPRARPLRLHVSSRPGPPRWNLDIDGTPPRGQAYIDVFRNAGSVTVRIPRFRPLGTVCDGTAPNVQRTVIVLANHSFPRPLGCDANEPSRSCATMGIFETGVRFTGRKSPHAFNPAQHGVWQTSSLPYSPRRRATAAWVAATRSVPVSLRSPSRLLPGRAIVASGDGSGGRAWLVAGGVGFPCGAVAYPPPFCCGCCARRSGPEPAIIPGGRRPLPHSGDEHAQPEGNVELSDDRRRSPHSDFKPSPQLRSRLRLSGVGQDRPRAMTGGRRRCRGSCPCSNSARDGCGIG